MVRLPCDRIASKNLVKEEKVTGRRGEKKDRYNMGNHLRKASPHWEGGEGGGRGFSLERQQGQEVFLMLLLSCVEVNASIMDTAETDRFAT